MKVSVITVCRNAEKTIEHTIKSVIHQTYKNIEFVIIDGLSTDGTIDLIQKYSDRVSYYISEKDSGIYNAMNKGLKACSGDICIFMNANDSFYDDNVVEDAVKNFQVNPNVGFLFGDVQFTDPEMNDIHILRYNNFTHTQEFQFNNMCHQVIFYKTLLIKKLNGYDESYKVYGDHELNVRVLVVENVAAKYIDRIIARYQTGGFSEVMLGTGLNQSEKERIYHSHRKKFRLPIVRRFIDILYFKVGLNKIPFLRRLYPYFSRISSRGRKLNLVKS